MPRPSVSSLFGLSYSLSSLFGLSNVKIQFPCSFLFSSQLQHLTWRTFKEVYYVFMMHWLESLYGLCCEERSHQTIHFMKIHFGRDFTHPCSSGWNGTRPFKSKHRFLIRERLQQVWGDVFVFIIAMLLFFVLLRASGSSTPGCLLFSDCMFRFDPSDLLSPACYY